jgi:hypothetical protein
MFCAKLRNVIWQLFEDPHSSRAAKVFDCESHLITKRDVSLGFGYCQLWVPVGFHRHAHSLHRARIPGENRSIANYLVTNKFIFKIIIYF